MMRTIDQTRLHDPTEQTAPGNCFAACVATILGLNLPDVPDQIYDWECGEERYLTWRRYWLRFATWLHDRGIGYLEVDTDEADFDPRTLVDVPGIASGPSPRDPKILHAVVVCYRRTDERTMTLEILHDPHPSRAGLDGGIIKSIGYFVGGVSTCKT